MRMTSPAVASLSSGPLCAEIVTSIVKHHIWKSSNLAEEQKELLFELPNIESQGLL